MLRQGVVIRGEREKALKTAYSGMTGKSHLHGQG
jgi:hypothetical protein